MCLNFHSFKSFLERSHSLYKATLPLDATQQTLAFLVRFQFVEAIIYWLLMSMLFSTVWEQYIIFSAHIYNMEGKLSAQNAQIPRFLP